MKLRETASSSIAVACQHTSYACIEVTVHSVDRVLIDDSSLELSVDKI